jgi:hypothetical protein
MNFAYHGVRPHLYISRLLRLMLVMRIVPTPVFAATERSLGGRG